MATNKYTIEVDERGVGQTERKVSGLNGAMTKLGKSIGAVAAAYYASKGVLNGMGKAIALAGEQEAAEKRLEVALGRVSTGLLKQAGALQKLTTFGDEAIISAQALIAAFVDDEEQIKKATEATLDLAAAKGMDLNAAADLVSKTLGSTTNAMSRYGIEVEGAVGSTERLDSLTSAIAEKFGGQAQAAAGTMAGQIQQMKNAVGDAGEALGAALAPAVIKVSELLKNGAERFTDFWAAAEPPAEMNEKVRNLLGDIAEQQFVYNKRLKEIETELATNTDLTLDQSAALQEEYNWLVKTNAELERNAQLFKDAEAAKPITDDLVLRYDMTIEKVDELAEKTERYRTSMTDLAAVLATSGGLRQMADNVAYAAEQFGVAGELAKGLAYTSALVDTYAAANAAYLSTAKIPVVGPALAPIAAAAAIAAGLANVKQIQKAAEGFDDVVRKPTLFLAGEAGPETVQITNLSKPGGGMNSPGGGITINGDIYGFDDFARKVRMAQSRNALGFA